MHMRGYTGGVAIVGIYLYPAKVIVNSFRVGDWIAEWAIIASNVRSCKNLLSPERKFTCTLLRDVQMVFN